MARRLPLPWALLLLLLPGAVRAAPVDSVYLVQDSGWMEPFYSDAAVPFRPLLRALVAASDAGGSTVIASFDQDNQVPGRPSPHVLYRGPNDPAPVARAIDALAPPVQPNGHLADADLDGALVGAIDRILSGRAGIVWMVTNNRNSPGNSQRVSENTRDFARRLGSSPVLPVIVSYPVRLPATGRLYSAGGLIVYGIAYGAEAGDALRRLAAAPPLRTLFREPAVQLKPLDRAPLVFTPDAVTTPGMSARRDPDGTLRFSGVPGGVASSVEIRGSLRSDYYPHVIDRAALSLSWARIDPVPGRPGTALLGAAIAPAFLHSLAPGESLPGVLIRLEVPAIARAPGLAGWLQRDVVLRGTLRIALSDLELSLEPGFTAKMQQIAALDQLPSVFFDNRSVSEATATLPVVLRVRFSVRPLVLALGGLFGLLAAAALVLALLRRTREHAVLLGGQPRRVRLRSFERRIVVLPGGRRFALRGRPWGPPRVTERGDTDPR